MGSLWSSTPLMTASRLPWMNCGAANSPTKIYWTPRSSSWDWGRTSHGESHDSVREPAGPEAQQPTTATTAAPDAGSAIVVPFTSLFTFLGPPSNTQASDQVGSPFPTPSRGTSALRARGGGLR